MLVTAQEDSAGANHPLARRMAVIAFLTNNITIGTLWGSFGVLLIAVEKHLGVGRELSTLGVPAATLGLAVCAPFVGVLASRLSLRMLLLAGTILSTTGFILLATTASYALYLIAYGLFLGPGMAIGVILPPTLVTRWFVSGRGRALGIVCTPALIALVPLSASWSLQSFGLAAIYGALAALSALAVLANLFIVDYPPGDTTEAPPTPGTAAGAGSLGTMGVAALFRSPRFWALAMTSAASTTGSTIMAAQLVPMATTWGYSPTLAATLASIPSAVGIAGGTFFGWIADRIGSVTTLAIIVFDAAVLWSLVAFQPAFPIMAVLFALLGLHGSGILPVVGLALSNLFGRANFSRAYGISNFINLPFAVVCVPAAALVFTKTGSYSGAILGEVVFLGIAVILALAARQPKPVPNAAVAE